MDNTITHEDIKYISQNFGIRVEKEGFYISFNKLTFKDKLLGFFRTRNFDIFKSIEIKIEYKKIPAVKLFVVEFDTAYNKADDQTKEGFISGLNRYSIPEIPEAFFDFLRGGLPMNR